MNAGSKMLRSLTLAGIVAGFVTFAGPAQAVDNPASCTNDVDCIADPACGGSLCDWDSGLICKPSGTPNKGWCMADTDCKCHSTGATCDLTIHHCSKTTASAGTAGASGGTAGASGGTAGAGTAGASGGTAGTSGSAGAAPAPSSGGCSVASSATSGGLAALVGLALVAGRLVRRRRRA